MTPTEKDKRFRAARRAVLRDRTSIQRDTFRAVDGLLQSSLDRILATLAGQPTDYNRWSLPPLQAEIRRTLSAWSTEAGAVVTAGADRSWEAGRVLIDEPLSAAGVPIRASIQTLSTRQLFAMREFVTGRIQDISLVAANKINSALGLVITGVQSPAEAIGHVARLLGDESRGRAITIVRTELGRAFSSAGQSRMAQARHLLPGLKKQWRRSGKIHSRPSHDAADGQIRDVDLPFNVGGVTLMFPRDPKAPAKETINCGCESLPHMDSWEMETPGRQPFTQEELAASPFKRNLQAELEGLQSAAA